jgi:hypothetical protein
MCFSCTIPELAGSGGGSSRTRRGRSSGTGTSPPSAGRKGAGSRAAAGSPFPRGTSPCRPQAPARPVAPVYQALVKGTVELHIGFHVRLDKINLYLIYEHYNLKKNYFVGPEILKHIFSNFSCQKVYHFLSNFSESR